MAERTKISWAHSTVNFWAGCTKVSPACKNCYAERDTKRRGFVEWGPGAERRLVKNAGPNARAWDKEAEATQQDRRVFAFSWADWLDQEVDPTWLRDFLTLVDATPHLTWLLLSKRLEFWAERLEAAIETRGTYPALGVRLADRWLQGNPPHNVWLGTTVEDQERADERIPLLIQTPARLRFLSMEPLLGRTGPSLERFLWLTGPSTCGPWTDALRRRRGGGGIGGQAMSRKPAGDIDWVITGGESGPSFRPLDLDAVREVRDACLEAGVPFHHKQHSSAKPGGAGRELDGVVWDQVPSEERHALAQMVQA